MEKFGIFDLLDTLSALAAANTPESEETDMPAAEQETDAMQPKQTDPAYLPPQYGEASAAVADSERNALGAFLERHEAISKKIDGKK